jgi:hypothetical protein
MTKQTILDLLRPTEVAGLPIPIPAFLAPAPKPIVKAPTPLIFEGNPGNPGSASKQIADLSARIDSLRDAEAAQNQKAREADLARVLEAGRRHGKSEATLRHEAELKAAGEKAEAEKRAREARPVTGYVI